MPEPGCVDVPLAPAVAPPLRGTPWKVADARDRVLVLNVWGQWCGPCVAEMPPRAANYRALAGYGAILVNYMVVNVLFVGRHSYSGM